MSDKHHWADTESDIAEKVCDGLEIISAFFAVEDIALRRAIKKVVLALSVNVDDEPQRLSRPEWYYLKQSIGLGLPLADSETPIA